MHILCQSSIHVHALSRPSILFYWSLVTRTNFYEAQVGVT
jgi:hypothetical protein